MKRRPLPLFCLLPALLAALMLPCGAFAQESVTTGNADSHVAASLIPEYRAAVPGDTLWLALRLDHQDDWHTYWINPGEAGLPTTIDWDLPDGVEAGEIVWPVPQRFDLPGDVVDFGYEGEVFHLIPLSIADDFSADTLTLGATVDWLECEVVCIPGGADIALSLPVTDGPATLNADWQYGFERTRRSRPRGDISFDAMYHFEDGDLQLLVQATEPVFENAESITWIPDVNGVVDYLDEQDITTQVSSLQLSQAQHSRVARRGPPERLGGLLLVEQGGEQTAYSFSGQPSGVNAGLASSAVPARRDLGLGTVFLFALLGGLVLNLMPCVFPVLSLKVLSLANSGGAVAREQRLHGIAYAAGVMLSFLLLAVVLLSLQAGGAAIGWGFQLQQPWLVATLIFVFFVMGLSMSGVVEFGTSIMGIGGDLQEKEGLKGSFFTGVLATVVASPCTAPFMGAALGFAFTQSMPIALTVFLALGFGMALPFLLLSFIPSLGRFMPRPGAWMQTFRQILAFPLYATAVWLLWVLGNQAGTTGMAMVLAACVVLAFGCWLWQKRHHSHGAWRHAGTALVLLCVVLAGGVLFSPLLAPRTGSVASAADAAFEPYSAARLDALRAAGTPVFVNMTASWCITCLVNERVALSSEAVTAAMADRGITYLKGDWTNNDPAITAVLREYETAGVPLYLVYPADPARPAEVLPQILTEGIVLDAFDRI